MSRTNDAPQKVELRQLVRELRRSVTDAARDLDAEQARTVAETGSRYVIPRARITARMGLTMVNSQVQGILWWKEKSQDESSVVSTLEFEMVALPGKPKPEAES